MSKRPVFSADQPDVKTLASRLGGEPLLSDSLGEPETVASLINTAFWASLQTEEGRPVVTSLVFMPSYKWDSLDVFRFSQAPKLSVGNLAKISVSFPFEPGAVLVDVTSSGEFRIAGVVIRKPQDHWLLDILGPGYLVLRNGPSVQASVLPDGSSFLFDRLARLENEWCDLLFDNLQHTCVGQAVPFPYLLHFLGSLRVLARSMVEHRQGGTVVFTDSESDSWRQLIDIKYEFEEPVRFVSEKYQAVRDWREDYNREHRDRLSEFLEEGRSGKADDDFELLFLPESQEERDFQEALRLAGGLSAVDGAVVMTNCLEILGYGAKLKPESLSPFPIREWFPDRGFAADTTKLQKLGGTRHRSAAEFAVQDPGSCLFVASQDGRFTIFCADETEQALMAFRSEILLI